MKPVSALTKNWFALSTASTSEVTSIGERLVTVARITSRRSEKKKKTSSSQSYFNKAAVYRLAF